jgi:hypothetical protein
MSFGFGVGDFIAVLKLAKEVRRGFAGAPEQFSAVSNESVFALYSNPFHNPAPTKSIL